MRKTLKTLVASVALGVVVTLGFAPVTPGLFTTPAVATPTLPVTIPALTGWTHTGQTWTLGADTVVVRADTFDTRAQLLVDELSAYLGTPVQESTSTQTSPHIVLTVDEARATELKEEGYQLSIAPSGVTITAATDDGLFWGTRTLSQMLRQTLTLPTGSVIDTPKYAERAVTLCACQINIAPEWIDRFLNEMADLKLNQILLELKVKSDRYPEANTWSYYTREDIKALVAKADSYGIDVIPEINSPGHMNIWLENKPELQLVNNDGVRQPDRLDLSKPEAVQFYKDLIDEYDGVFTTKWWHMGADEYMINSGFHNFTALTTWAQRTYGEGATIGDAFIAFINDVNAHVKSKGMKLRIWNDGIINTQVVSLDRDIVVEYWLGSGRRASIVAAEGYKLMNAHSHLYYSRGAPTVYTIQARGPAALYGRWNIGNFPGNQNLGVDHEAITGAKLSIWPDNGIRQTENEVEEEIKDGLRFASQLFWRGAMPSENVTWDSFKSQRIDVIERSPLWENRDTTPIAEGSSYLITDARGEGLSIRNNPSTQGASDTWALRKTPDGYYQLKSVDANRCLGVYTGDTHLSTVTQVGAAVDARPCAADIDYRWQVANQGNYQLRNPQKWELIPVDKAAGSYQLRNAVTLQHLVVATGQEAQHVDFWADNSRRPAVGSLVQLPHDMIVGNSSVFTFSHDSRSFTAVASTSQGTAFPAASVVEGISDQGEATISVMVTNTGDSELSNVEVSPLRASGWAVSGGTQSIATIAPGEDGTVTFTARPTWRLGEYSLPFLVRAAGAERITRVSVVGTCGPAFQPTASATDSQETRGEGPVNGHLAAASDGNPATFWHTQWQGSTPGFPHWIEVDLGQARQVCGYAYLPRQGSTPNGRVKDYRLSAYNDPAQAQIGDVVAAGSLPNSTERTYIALPGVNARYLRFTGLNAQPDVGDSAVMSAAEISVVLGTLPPQPTLVTPQAVTFNADTYRIPDVEGVEYFAGDTRVEAGEYDATPGAKVTISARPVAGYDFTDEADTQWSHHFVRVITPVEVTFDDMNLTYTIPEVDGVEYRYGSTVTSAGTHKATYGELIAIAATLTDAENIRFLEGAVTEWSHTFPQEPSTPRPNDPSQEQPVDAIRIEPGGARIVPGATLTITGTGFAPGAQVSGVIHSDPINLGTVAADTVGTAVFKVMLPSTITLGEHTVTLSDAVTGRVVKKTFQVVATSTGGNDDGSSSTLSGVNKSVQQGTSSLGTAAANTKVKSGLAKTGTNTQYVILLAGALVVAGALAFKVMTRRR
ncbi:family 20 glycosylhydrolase [Schaalia suimastitidis]|uniref:family 20 glycosylhydrolase n=1 Tax=Schaalia suimastitidis TaxID=121163 RepID=UPI0013F43A62|nr:family 20 glycosylhydrolase [Schaalia suimastitidis]